METFNPHLSEFTDAEEPPKEREQITPVLCFPCKVVDIFENTIPENIVPSSNKSIEDIESLRMTCVKDIAELTPIIKIGESTISTPGNITAISGEGKSGKTAAIGAIMAGALAMGDYDGFAGFQVTPNLKKHALIHIETENSESRHQVNHRTVVRRSGHENNTPDNFLSYNIRRKEIPEYRTLTEQACKGAIKQFGGIFLIVIDGIADFITDVNNPTEANKIVHWCEVLAITYNAPVIVIVHVNPNSEKERGHLGSQIQRKCESLLLIKRENDNSIIEAKLLRNAGVGDTPKIQFSYDKSKGYHVATGIDSVLITDLKKAKRIEKAKEIAANVFTGQKSLGYEEALEQIRKVAGGGTNAVKEIFKDMKAHEFIYQRTDKLWALRTNAV